MREARSTSSPPPSSPPPSLLVRGGKVVERMAVRWCALRRRTTAQSSHVPADTVRVRSGFGTVRLAVRILVRTPDNHSLSSFLVRKQEARQTPKGRHSHRPNTVKTFALCVTTPRPPKVTRPNTSSALVFLTRSKPRKRLFIRRSSTHADGVTSLHTPPAPNELPPPLAPRRL